MRHIGVVTCLWIILLASQATAVDPSQKAKTAESKAGVLEQNSSAKGGKAGPVSGNQHLLRHHPAAGSHNGTGGGRLHKSGLDFHPLSDRHLLLHPGGDYHGQDPGSQRTRAGER